MNYEKLCTTIHIQTLYQLPVDLRRMRRWLVWTNIQTSSEILKTTLLVVVALTFFQPEKASAAGCPSWTLKNAQEGGTSSGGNIQTSSAFSSPLTNPSLIIVAVSNTSTGTLNTPTDTATNSYIDSGAGKVLLGSWAFQLFYALNSHTTASNFVYMTNGANPNHAEIWALEFTGGATSNPVDKYTSNANANTGSGGGQNVVVGPLTPSYSGELFVGVNNATNGLGVFTGSPWTTQEVNLSIGNEAVGAVQGTAAAFTGTWYDNANNDIYSAMMVAFKHVVCNPPHVNVM
jgi:hypothetical protein